MSEAEAARLDAGARVRQVRDLWQFDRRQLVAALAGTHGRWGTVMSPWSRGSMVVQFDDGELLQMGSHNLGDMWFSPAAAPPQERER